MFSFSLIRLNEPCSKYVLCAGGLALSIFAGVSIASANDAVTGATIGYTCMGCHGVNGQSPGSIPSIAGQSAERLTTQMMAYRDGSKNGTIMNRIAKGYTPEEIKAVAAFFAQQPAK